MTQRGLYEPTGRPPYAFCEPVWSGPLHRWHIRKIDPSVGLRLGGGIDSASLCSAVPPNQGWDLQVRITEHHLSHACPQCVAAYRANVHSEELREIHEAAQALRRLFPTSTGATVAELITYAANEIQRLRGTPVLAYICPFCGKQTRGSSCEHCGRNSVIGRTP